MVFGVSNASPVSGDKELDAKPVATLGFLGA